MGVYDTIIWEIGEMFRDFAFSVSSNINTEPLSGSWLYSNPYLDDKYD